MEIYYLILDTRINKNDGTHEQLVREWIKKLIESYTEAEQSLDDIYVKYIDVASDVKINKRWSYSLASYKENTFSMSMERIEKSINMYIKDEIGWIKENRAFRSVGWMRDGYVDWNEDEKPAICCAILLLDENTVFDTWNDMIRNGEFDDVDIRYICNSKKEYKRLVEIVEKPAFGEMLLSADGDMYIKHFRRCFLM